MNNLIYWIIRKKLSFIYAGSMFLALELILASYGKAGTGNFWFLTLLFGVVLTAELFVRTGFLVKRYTEYEIKQLIRPLITSHALQQFVLPILLYFGAVGFIFFNPSDVLVHIMIVLVTALFWLLFLNLRGVYDRDFELGHLSHSVYNFVKIFVFFLNTNLVLEFSRYQAANRILIFTLVFVLSAILLILAVGRYLQVTPKSSLIVIILSIAMGLFSSYIGLIVFTTYFKVSVYLTVIYYLILSFVHHKAEGTLTLTTYIEYTSVAILGLMILSF